jgi:hypothetical protein
MQTFLPYPDFFDSAKVLDRQRLGKQRVENLQIMDAIVNGRGYVNHPAVHMWRGYEYALLDYQDAVVSEWMSRGYKDTCWIKTLRIFTQLEEVAHYCLPPWVGDFEFHRSHQSNLMRKDPVHYGRIFPTVPDDLEYIWPATPEQKVK